MRGTWMGRGAALVSCALIVAPPSVAQVTTNFRYDALGRLVRSQDSEGRTVLYKYDAAGNRISLGNGAAPGEIIITALSASSNRGGFTGLAAEPMRDLVFNSAASAHITQADSLAFVQADIGAAKIINHIDLAPPDRALAGGGVDALNGAQVQYSQDAFTWTNGPTVGGAVAGVYKTIGLGGVSARYVRVVKSGAALGLGDFRVYAIAKPENASPVAGDDTRSKLNKDEPTTFDPRLNDSDANGDGLTITAVSPANHGQTSFTGQSITHVPDAGYVGQDSFTYTISDDRGGFATANVTLTYNTPAAPDNNHSPIAVDDGGPTARIEIPYAAGFSTPTIRVLDNDSDPDGDTLSIVSAGPVQHGLLSISDGAIRYFPVADQFTGFEDFPYTISDGRGKTATARIWVRIGNTYPTATADNVSIYQNTGVAISALDNDHDAEGDPLTISGYSQPAHGSVTPFGDTLLIYTPNHDYVGSDSFTYNIVDDHGGTSSSSVFVEVKAGKPNNAPIARNDFSADSPASVPTGMTVKLMVLANDTDPDDDPIAITAFSQAAHGTLSLPSGAQYLQYTPSAGYLGDDSFTYTISDGRGATATASVHLRVIYEYNSPPVAGDDSFTVSNYRTAQLLVSRNDSDPQGDDRTIVSITQPAHGSAVINGAMITYTPTSGYVGADSFTYTITDGRGEYATATVSLTVIGNLPPVAADDAVTARHNKAALIADLLANDSDPNEDLLNFLSYTQPSHGLLSSAGSYAFAYTPTTDFVGTDSFTYTITDGQGGTATATVTVTVPPEPPPTPGADNYTVEFNTSSVFDVLSNDSDPEGDVVSISAVATPNHGTASIVSGKIAYTPTKGYSGGDSFSYSVSDGKGGVASATVSVTVVRSSNQVPTAANDSYTTPANTAKPLTPLSNDADPDGDPLVVTAVGAPAHGAATITQDGAGVLYAPQTNYAGADTFNYTISDGHGGVASAQISVTTLPTPNRNPKPVDDSAGLVVTNTSTTIPVLANDKDPDGDTLTIASASQPAHGAVTIVGGAVTYAPATNYSGQDSFTYTVSDGHGGTGTATVNAVVTINHPPVARDYGPTTGRGARSLPVTTFTSDPDYDPITVTAVGTPAHGTASIQNGAYALYTPSSNYTGPDSFTYTISDGRGGTSTANVLLNVGDLSGSSPAWMGERRADAEENVTSEFYLDGSNPNGANWIYTVVTPPAHGAMSAIGAYGMFTYKPTQGYAGPDSLTFRISDGRGGTFTGTFNVTVMQSAARRPVVVGDGPFTTAFNTPIALSTLLNNDSDPEGEPLTIVGVVQGTGGKAALIDSHTVIFIPDNNFTGSNASFSYYATDGRTKPILGAVSINVSPPPSDGSGAGP